MAGFGPKLNPIICRCLSFWYFECSLESSFALHHGVIGCSRKIHSTSTNIQEITKQEEPPIFNLFHKLGGLVSQLNFYSQSVSQSQALSVFSSTSLPEDYEKFVRLENELGALLDKSESEKKELENVQKYWGDGCQVGRIGLEECFFSLQSGHCGHMLARYLMFGVSCEVENMLEIKGGKSMKDIHQVYIFFPQSFFEVYLVEK